MLYIRKLFIFIIIFWSVTGCSNTDNVKHLPKKNPTSIRFKKYVDSLLKENTNSAFEINGTNRTYLNKNDSMKIIEVDLDTLSFQISSRYVYDLKSDKKDTLVQGLLDELKSISEIKREYYKVSVLITEICGQNEFEKKPDCHTEITDFTFLDRELNPVCAYFWWRGSLREKKVYRYNQKIIKDTISVKL